MTHRMLYRVHPKPISPIDQGRSPLWFLHKVSEKVWLGIIQALHAAFRDDAAIICLEKRGPFRVGISYQEIEGDSTHPHYQSRFFLCLRTRPRHSATAFE